MEIGEITITSPNGYGDVIGNMEEFDRKYGFDRVSMELMTPEFFRFRLKFLLEELQETFDAYDRGDAPEVIDGLIDLVVVAIGTLDFAKVDVRWSWNEVLRANLSKLPGSNSKRPGSAGIDLIKPNGWAKPDHSNNIGIMKRFFDDQKLDFCAYLENYRFGELPDLPLGLPIPPPREKSRSEQLALEVAQKYQEAGLDLPSVEVLLECALLNITKAKDYTSKGSGITTADYFTEGISSVFHEIWKKALRLRSVMWKIRNGGKEEHESLEDSFKDIAVYSAMAVTWIRGKIWGQRQNVDIFNQETK